MLMVSVAVITYNMERYLRPLLDSILKQKVNFEYEIVIDDDHSPDNSREIIREYAAKYPQIHPIYRDSNVGGSRNMFGVMNACRGKYIAILEGDDFWEDENKLQYQINFLEQHPEYIGMTCNSWCEHGEVPTFSDVMRKRTEPKVFSIDDFCTRHFRDRLPSSTDTWVFRNIFRLFPDEDFSLFYKVHNMVWDQALILLLYGKGEVYADPKVVSHHRSVTRMDGTNFQSLYIQKNMLYGDSQMYKMMEEYMQEHLQHPCGAFYQARGEIWLDSVFRALQSHKKEDAEIARQIWHDQERKGMLICMLVGKCIGIVGRKIKKWMH